MIKLASAFRFGRGWIGVLALCFALGLSTQARATLACTVTSNSKDIQHVTLLKEPDATSEALRDVPVEDLVSYPDDELAPHKSEAWAWVRHDKTQKDIWQSGDYGWMPKANLSNCG